VAFERIGARLLKLVAIVDAGLDSTGELGRIGDVGESGILDESVAEVLWSVQSPIGTRSVACVPT
jgi:hypothetical protein